MRRNGKNLHVPLPEELHAELRAVAERMGRPATEIAREAIESWLADERRRARREAIAAYAAAHAGTLLDLDPDLERAGIECLLGKRPRKRRSSSRDRASRGRRR